MNGDEGVVKPRGKLDGLVDVLVYLDSRVETEIDDRDRDLEPIDSDVGLGVPIGPGPSPRPIEHPRVQPPQGRV